MLNPFILEVQLNTTVTWQINDAIAHASMTMADLPPYFNLHAISFTVIANPHVQFTFAQAGLYHSDDPGMVPSSSTECIGETSSLLNDGAKISYAKIHNISRQGVNI